MTDSFCTWEEDFHGHVTPSCSPDRVMTMYFLKTSKFRYCPYCGDVINLKEYLGWTNADELRKEGEDG